MKRTLTLLTFSLLSIFSVKSQNVTITDPGFLEYLQFNYPNCMSGNQMDTTCTSITDVTYIELTPLMIQSTINDLFGIEYFDNLDFLSIENQLIDSIFNLPNSLTELSITNSGVTYFDNFPANIEIISVAACPISNIPPLPDSLISFHFQLCPNLIQPTIIPVGLNSYDVTACNILSLPVLPNSLKSLNVSVNPGIVLGSLPDSLWFFGCTESNFTSLPTLPNNLYRLDCQLNNLTTLPTLPSTLRKLFCAGNPLGVLPVLPDEMYIISASSCQLTTITNFPLVLLSPNGNGGYIDIHNNMLVELPEIPNTTFSLLAQDNQLQCLPNIPESVYQIQLQNNFFTCIPNLTPTMSDLPYLDSLPLCNGSNGQCSGSAQVVGEIINDENSNCNTDPSENGVGAVPMRLYDDANNELLLVSSAPSGEYYFNTGIYPSYRVEIDTLNKPYTVNCSSPGIDSTFSIIGAADSTIQDVDFLIGCKPGFDVGIQSVIATGFVFPGQQHTLSIVAGDLSNWNVLNMNCATNVSGTVTIDVSGGVSYVSPANGALVPTTVNGNVFTYEVTDFSVINLETDFGLILETDTTATADDTICVNVFVTPIGGDNNPDNNEFSFCYHVVNSYDPNDKKVYPESVLPLFDDWLTYTVRFQNTGNAAAFNIKLKDRLSNLLDYSTFEMINSSHLNTYSLEGDMLTTNFPDIMLVDSTTNFEESIGYFQYKIKPISNLPLGTEIENKAYIYFDYNAPIITNTAITVFEEPATSDGASVPNYIRHNVVVYPNPNNGEFTIQLSSELTNMNVKLFSLSGAELKFELNKIMDSKISVKVNDNNKGLTFIAIQSDQGVFYSKVVLK